MPHPSSLTYKALLALGCAGLCTLSAPHALAQDCPAPNHERLKLELLDVTIDGVVETNVSAYTPYEVRLAATSATQGRPPIYLHHCTVVEPASDSGCGRDIFISDWAEGYDVP